MLKVPDLNKFTKLKVPHLDDIAPQYEQEQTRRTLNLHRMQIKALGISINQRNKIIETQEQMINILKMMIGLSSPPQISLPPQTSLPPKKRKHGKPATEKKVKFKLEDDNIDFDNIFN